MNQADKRTNINGGSDSDMPRRRCRALVVKSASVPAITRNPTLPFMFQKFNVSLPAHLTARVTERIDYDIYLMRNSEILDDLKNRMVTATTPLTSRLCLDRGICCIARLIRPARLSNSTFEPQIYRAIASHYRPDDKTCEVLLVDFGQTIVCSVSDLFELHDQPIEVLEKPTASFRCRVKRFSPSKRNANKGIRLLDENDYNICLTLKCARDLYWAKVTLSDTDFVLYYKKPRVRKEKNEKNVNKRINVDTTLEAKNASRVGAVRKFEQRKEKLHEEEVRLYEQEELLRKEEENFTNESIRKEQELQLIALQMQLWDISAKLDMVASNDSNFAKTACNPYCPQLQQNNYSGVPVYMTNGYDQSKIRYRNGNSASSIPQQQQNVAINQSWGQQWPYYLSAPHTPNIITPINQYNRPYQQMILSSGMPSQMPYIPNTQISYSNAANNCRFGTPRYNRNINKVDLYSSNIVAPAKTVRALLVNDTSSEVTMYIQRDYHRCKISISTDSFWCHRKLEYGEPPHRTISDYCNIAKKQSGKTSPHDNHDNFPRRSLSSISQYTKDLSNTSNRQSAQIKLKQPGKDTGDASDASYTSSVTKPVYTSDESDDYGQLCINTNSYEKQEMLVSPELQISLHLDDERQSFPTYQMYHKVIDIANGNELVVQRIGSDTDWPVFFVTTNPTSQDISIECFDSMQKLNADEIVTFGIGVLCLVQCSDLRRTKVRAIVERFNENIIQVRHIDDGHVETIQLNELWSIEKLSPSVRTRPALAVPCILASFNEAKLVKTINCHKNEIPCVGQLMRLLFKKQRDSDGIWIVELITGMNSDDISEE
ncbi:unnamed protein product [Onchocerca ochengi]|uniref:Tudor domain-containing protein n=1 Tax=Onchocerca ochengi TaxID=42157 RepID=A0A182EG12_ONCOC|nr:unnamed protein product [Onchocerca ochengi]